MLNNDVIGSNRLPDSISANVWPVIGTGEKGSGILIKLMTIVIEANIDASVIFFNEKTDLSLCTIKFFTSS
jgi:hypothetical protein